MEHHHMRSRRRCLHRSLCHRDKEWDLFECQLPQSMVSSIDGLCGVEAYMEQAQTH